MNRNISIKLTYHAEMKLSSVICKGMTGMTGVGQVGSRGEADEVLA